MSSLYSTRFRNQIFEGPPVQYHDRLYASASTDPILPGFILLRRENGDIEIVSVKNREEIQRLMDPGLDIDDVRME